MGRRYGAARPQENFLVLTTCTGRGRDAGNEAAGGAAGCVLRVRVLKPKVGGWRLGWGRAACTREFNNWRLRTGRRAPPDKKRTAS